MGMGGIGWVDFYPTEPCNVAYGYCDLFADGKQCRERVQPCNCIYNNCKRKCGADFERGY